METELPFPNFQSMSIVAKRPPISATAEHLLVTYNPMCYNVCSIMKQTIQLDVSSNVIYSFLVTFNPFCLLSDILKLARMGWPSASTSKFPGGTIPTKFLCQDYCNLC